MYAFSFIIVTTHMHKTAILFLTYNGQQMSAYSNLQLYFPPILNENSVAELLTYWPHVEREVSLSTYKSKHGSQPSEFHEVL